MENKLDMNIPQPQEQFQPIQFGEGSNEEEEEQQHVEEENDSEDEGIEDYNIGGYHPVHIGEVIQKRYVIIQKLGWGHFSTVWLSKDFKYNTYVALKIQKSAPHYLEAAYDEVEILQKVAKQASNPEWIQSLKEYYKDDKKKKTFTRDDCQVIQLLNSFIYQGPYGNHFCMVFEIMSVNLLEIIKRYNYKGIPIPLAKIIAKQVLIGLDFLHRFCQVIHTDLKPENVLVCLTQEEIKQIVEKGQLDSCQKIKERIKQYQIQHGIYIQEQEEQKVEDSEDENSENQEEEAKEEKKTLTKQQKKYQRKKAAKKRKNQQQKEEQQKQMESEQNNNNKDANNNNNGNNNNNNGSNNINNKKNNNNNNNNKNDNNDVEQNDEKPKKKKRNKKNKNKNNNQTNNDQNNNQNINQNDNNQQKDKEEEQKEEQIPDEIRYKFDNYCGRGERIDENIRVKIADLGNACWTYHHFATKIQTRQYRSPESIIGMTYDTTADIWSFACMMFEMITGDFLFQPRKNPNYSKNEDHLAQIEELIKKFPLKFSLAIPKAKKIFDKEGNLRKIPTLQYWPLKSVLIEKYQIKQDEANTLNSFLMSMLQAEPLKRASARQVLLDSDWLKGKPNYLFKYTEQEFQRYLAKKQLLSYDEVQLNSNEAEDSDIYDADQSQNTSVLEEDDELFADCKYQFDYKLVDRSFTNLGYLGYGDGIILEDLDQNANWQFENFQKQK